MKYRYRGICTYRWAIGYGLGLVYLSALVWAWSLVWALGWAWAMCVDLQWAWSLMGFVLTYAFLVWIGLWSYLWAWSSVVRSCIYLWFGPWLSLSAFLSFLLGISPLRMGMGNLFGQPTLSTLHLLVSVSSTTSLP